MWLPFVSILLIRSIDTTDPFVEWAIFNGFIVVHVLLVAMAFYMRMKIAAQSDTTPLVVPVPKQPFGEDANKKQEYEHTFVQAYDNSQWSELFMKKIGIGLCVIAFVYWKWKMVIPFLFQCIHNPLQIYQHQLFKIHVLGQPAKGDLARPWPVADPRPEFLKKWSEMASAPAKDDKKVSRRNKNKA